MQVAKRSQPEKATDRVTAAMWPSRKGKTGETGERPVAAGRAGGDEQAEQRISRSEKSGCMSLYIPWVLTNT